MDKLFHPALYMSYDYLSMLGFKKLLEMNIGQGKINEICREIATTLSIQSVNTLRPRQNGHFPDDILKNNLLNWNVWNLIKISLKFVPKDAMINIEH